MLQFLSNKSRAKTRRASYVHALLNVALPIAVLVLVSARLPYLAVTLVLLAKWRVLAVQPRYWLVNMRSNSVDLIVNISFVLLMHSTPNFIVQCMFTVGFIIWLVFIKPRSEIGWVSIQAATAQVLGLVALGDLISNGSINVWPEFINISLVFLISVASARHFLSSYGDRYLLVLSLSWGLFMAELAWILNHWLILYERYVSHLVLLGTVFGYVVMRLYAKSNDEKLGSKEMRILAVFCCVILLVVVLLSNWRRSLY